MDLIKHKGRYYIYIPPAQHLRHLGRQHPRPVERSVDLKIAGAIDPGHAVGEDGKRYLFVNGVRRIEPTDDGLATVGNWKSLQPWRYPADWVVEMFAPEAPSCSSAANGSTS
jgi:xylan 1,4-beta-xylosidase